MLCKCEAARGFHQGITAQAGYASFTVGSAMFEKKVGRPITAFILPCMLHKSASQQKKLKACCTQAARAAQLNYGRT
jgi:hypothetical protein